MKQDNVAIMDKLIVITSGDSGRPLTNADCDEDLTSHLTKCAYFH